MRISDGWYAVRQCLEVTLDRLFDLPPEHFVEFDSLLTPEEIDSLGCARNFPHLTCLMCSIEAEDRVGFSKGEQTLEHGYAPRGVEMALLPATCYKVYLDLKGQNIRAPTTVGCIAKCFRHEDKALDAYRGFNFTMKEFVHLGSAEDAKGHLERGRARLDFLMNSLGIPFAYETASDPFFDEASSVALLSRLMPTKRELVFDDHAVGSLNYHRGYFGEKFGITLAGAPVHTSCVAFGIERWMSMLKDTLGDPTRALDRLAQVPAIEDRLLESTP